MNGMDTDIRELKGIGPTKAKAFQKLGISRVSDLIRHFPRDYEDRRALKTVAELADGETACTELLITAQPRLSHIRKGLDLVKFTAADETGSVNVTCFNQAWVKNAFSVGETVLFYGRFSRKGNRVEVLNPVYETSGKAGRELLRIMPVYPLTAGINQAAMRRAVEQGLEACGDSFPEPVPKDIRERYALASAAYSYENVHFPKDEQALAVARRRLVFEECYVLACAQQRMRERRTASDCRHPEKADPDGFASKLPFTLTGAQNKVIEETFGDMTEGRHPMNRLVQGDVGSGKTAVAAACCWLCAGSGMQAAVMAPTELLAEQHFRTFSSLLEPFGIRTELLVGSMTAKQKKTVYENRETGETDVVVGTHALLSENVRFHDLQLCVVDEQHRFGVLQRADLARKGEAPHLLVMSATPIPRTLALMIYGDLDISVIDELPPGRQTVDTYAVKEDMRPRIEAFARKHVQEGRQVYWVCPMVEASEETPDLRSAEETAERLQTKVFPDLRIGLLHGKMKAADKDEVMKRFSAGEVDILVATTVVEVGVDVPNAALMVVENADRFGLSQLHQLRGRVGRGRDKAYCVLFDSGSGDVSAERLSVMCRTNNGFVIAETDLKLRGPGDFLGSRQHGLPEMKIASLAEDVDVLVRARDAARDTLKEDSGLTKPEHSELKRRIEALYADYDGGMN